MTPYRLFVRLGRECLRFPGRLATAVVSLVVLSGAQLYLTWLAKRWADGPLLGDSADLRSLILTGMTVTGAMIGAAFASRYLLNSVNQRLVESLRDRALTRLLSLRLSAAQRLHTGEVVSRLMNDADLLSGIVRDVFKRLIGEGLVVVGALAMAFYLQWRLALLVIVLVPLVALLLSRLGGVIRRRGTRAQVAIGDLNAVLHEQLRGLTTVKGFQGEAVESARFAAQNRRYRRSVMRGEWWSSVLVTLVWTISGLSLWGILWYGSQLMSAGRITAGGLVAFCLYLLQTLDPLRRLSEVHAMLQRALAAAARVYEIIDCDDLEPSGGAALPVPRGALRFESVHFGYRPQEPVLQDLTLGIDPGEPVALVAASGGGKTTLAKLLVRFCEPQAGRVTLDGIDLRTLDLSALRRSICLVEQEPFLFRGGLIDNIRYGSWDAPQRRVDQAVALTGLETVIRALPAGLETSMAEAGRELSVGQKQRIALARAVLRDPPVLILDEATSALDSDTERQIFAQLEAWLRQRTTLVIAHRLSTISRFARVIVLERGRVVGDGSVAALLVRCPSFTQLFGEQLTTPGLAPVAAAP